MNINCLDIGIIQAFLDGELSGGEITRVSDHIGACDSCAVLLAQAEDENAVVFPALAREYDAMVPTQRLWTRIEGSIQFEKNSAPWWQKLRAIIVTDILNPQIGALAALLIVLGLFAIYKLSGPTGADNVTVAPRITTTPTIVNIETLPPSATSGILTPSRSSRPSVENASYHVPRVKAQQADSSAVQDRDAGRLPGEDSYVSTIASLTKSVNSDNDPSVMRASQQVAYARDMAVVDDSIKRMRAAVKRDPKNEAAKQMLSASYQNKIDLLNSVAQKQELVASLR